MPGIESVYGNLRKPGSFGVILQVPDPKILFNDVTNLGAFFVALKFKLRELGSGLIFTHETINDFIFNKKVTAGFACISLIGNHFFDVLSSIPKVESELLN